MICEGGRIDSASETGCLDTLSDIALRSVITWLILIASLACALALGLARLLTRHCPEEHPDAGLDLPEAR